MFLAEAPAAPFFLAEQQSSIGSKDLRFVAYAALRKHRSSIGLSDVAYFKNYIIIMLSLRFHLLRK